MELGSLLPRASNLKCSAVFLGRFTLNKGSCIENVEKYEPLKSLKFHSLNCAGSPEKGGHYYSCSLGKLCSRSGTRDVPRTQEEGVWSLSSRAMQCLPSLEYTPICYGFHSHFYLPILLVSVVFLETRGSVKARKRQKYKAYRK